MKVLFLITLQQSDLAYPIFKWKSVLEKHGYRFCVKTNHTWGKEHFDVAILTNPYIRRLWNAKSSQYVASGLNQKALLEDTIRKARNDADRVAIFDTRDGTASAYFDLLPKIDYLFKKQIYKERTHYATDQFSRTPSPWLGVHEKRLPKADDSQLTKIRVGWNIGFGDFSRFRRAAKLASWLGLTLPPFYSSPDIGRRFLVSFRGGLSGPKGAHRRLAIETLRSMKRTDIVAGGEVSKRRYLSELKDTFGILSPFGAGEICYRDFECLIAGGVLLKPSMQHISTYPDIFDPWETYIPLDWDFSDLPRRVAELNQEPERMLSIARKGQERYGELLSTPEYFIRHLRSMFT